MQPKGPRSDEWWCELTVGHAAGAARKRAAEHRRTAFGWMLTTPAAPAVWAVNRAQVVPGAGGLDQIEVVTAIEAAHDAAGLTHRAVDIRSRADAKRLAPALRAAGYAVAELEVLTVAPERLRERTSGERTGAMIDVAPATAEACLPVERAHPGDGTPEEQEQVANQWVLAPSTDVAHLLARDAAGTPAGSLVVHLANLHLEVDDLLTVPDQRRTGVGTALLRAVAELGIERDVGRITLLADPRGSAAQWYRRRGFAPVGRTAQAIRAEAL